MSGYKTYIVAAGSVVWAATGFLMGWLDQASAIKMIETALLAATIRHGISTSVGK